MEIRFFSNLGDDNATEISRGLGAREAVLLSTPGAARRTLNAARAFESQLIPIAADNGNTTIIFQVAGEFSARANGLAQELEEEREHTSKAPSPMLRAKFRLLANDIARRCNDFVSSERQKAVLATQATVKPNFFTCLEDLTVPILIQLDAEPSYTGYRRAHFVALQERGLQAASAVIRGELGAVVGRPYATLHAFDYDSGYQVGSRAARIPGLEGIATGLASFLNDSNYINSYMIKGRRFWVKGRRNVPQRYLRTLMVSLGLLDGFASQRGVLPYYHGLGGGAPIVLPLLSLCAFGSPLLSVDSTAPEKNASMGKLFVNRPAPLTLSVDSVAQALIEGRQVWNCPCPYCSALQREIPFDIDSARAYYNAHIAPRKITDDDLKLNDGIGRWLSICWATGKQPARRLIYRARVNHSHWAIAGVARELRERATSYTELCDWVAAQCEAYKATALPVYALQIDECLRLIGRLRPLK
jgi:hypothetical protein